MFDLFKILLNNKECDNLFCTYFSFIPIFLYFRQNLFNWVFNCDRMNMVFADFAKYVRSICRIYENDNLFVEVGFMLYLSCTNSLEGRCLVVITGKVKWFNNEKGFGFIEYKENEDIFVHYSSILSEGYKTLVEGQYVKFDLVRTDKGLQAKNVIEIKTALV